MTGRACEKNYTTDCLASFTPQNPEEFIDIIHAAAQQMKMKPNEVDKKKTLTMYWLEYIVNLL